MAEPLKKPEPSLYALDFYAWTQDQAAKLRARRMSDNDSAIDWGNAAEEIESLGRRDKREIRNRLRVLIAHLLKWRFQPAKRKSGWRATIREQRQRLDLVVRDSPSLQAFPAEATDEAYDAALLKASEESGLPRSFFPDLCPFTIEQILDPDFYPEAE